MGKTGVAARVAKHKCMQEVFMTSLIYKVPEIWQRSGLSGCNSQGGYHTPCMFCQVQWSTGEFYFLNQFSYFSAYISPLTGRVENCHSFTTTVVLRCLCCTSITRLLESSCVEYSRTLGWVSEASEYLWSRGACGAHA